MHTGQHYDDALSGVFFRELGLARPERELGIGGGSNSSQTARMLAVLEGVLGEVEPDAVLVYGDTNSTLAGARAGELAGVPVVHVEAGMRSFDRAMPEEVNRIATDRVSSLLLCSSEVARENLVREGIPGTSGCGWGRDGGCGFALAASGAGAHGGVGRGVRGEALGSTCWLRRIARGTLMTLEGWGTFLSFCALLPCRCLWCVPVYHTYP